VKFEQAVVVVKPHKFIRFFDVPLSHGFLLLQLKQVGFNKAHVCTKGNFHTGLPLTCHHWNICYESKHIFCNARI